MDPDQNLVLTFGAARVLLASFYLRPGEQHAAAISNLRSDTAKERRRRTAATVKWLAMCGYGFVAVAR